MQPLTLTFSHAFSLFKTPTQPSLSLPLSLLPPLFFSLLRYPTPKPNQNTNPSLSQIIVHACLDLHTYKSQPTNPNQNSFVLAYPKPTNGPIINPSNIPFFKSSNKIPNSQTHNQPNTYRKEWAFNHTQKNRLKITIEKDEKTTTSGWWALKGLAMEVCGRVMELRFREGLRFDLEKV